MEPFVNPNDAETEERQMTPHRKGRPQEDYDRYETQYEKGYGK